MHYVPGEHDIVDEGTGKAYLERYGKNTKGSGWYSFDQNGVHFIGLVNVANLKAGGLGYLGNDQLEWLEDDLKALKDSTPIVVFAHIPLWSIYPSWGWGTDDAAIALGLPQAVRIGDRSQWPHSPAHAEGRRQRHFPHRPLDGLPTAGSGHCTRAWPDARASRKAPHPSRHRDGHVPARRRTARGDQYCTRRRIEP